MSGCWIFVIEGILAGTVPSWYLVWEFYSQLTSGVCWHRAIIILNSLTSRPNLTSIEYSCAFPGLPGTTSLRCLTWTHRTRKRLKFCTSHNQNSLSDTLSVDVSSTTIHAYLFHTIHFSAWKGWHMVAPSFLSQKLPNHHVKYTCSRMMYIWSYLHNSK